MTLEIEYGDKKVLVPYIKDRTQPGFEIESGPNQRHSIKFFSDKEGQGGTYQVKEGKKRKYSPVPVHNSEEFVVETFDGDPIKVRGC